MERRISKKCETHMLKFKNDIKEWLDESELSKSKLYSAFLQYMYDYPPINLEKEDFQKRKRVKNLVPHFDRCGAKRANGDQCSRRKQSGHEHCGTHIKGTPHGEIEIETVEQKKQNKIEVYVQEIQGIHYYIDNNSNVYKTEDIASNSKNPAIIAKYNKNSKGDYKIPELGIS